MTVALETVGLSVDFGGFRALDGVNVRCRSGQIHAIIGPNGAGKTTFVNGITGLVALSSGHVLLGGRSLSAKRPEKIARAGISRTFQQPEVFDSLTPQEHLVACRPGLHGIRAAAPKARDLVSRLDDVPATELSFYSRRILELARALAMCPLVLFMDEPVSGLDESEREAMSAMVTDVAALGVAVVLIEHDMRVIHNLASEVTVLDLGVVVARGTPAELAANRAVARAYMGAS